MSEVCFISPVIQGDSTESVKMHMLRYDLDLPKQQNCTYIYAPCVSLCMQLPISYWSALKVTPEEPKEWT